MNIHAPLKLRAGRGMTLWETLYGHTLSASPGKSWKHPWFLTPGWSAVSQQWSTTVKPGLVNGLAPIFRTTVVEQASVEQDFGTNPLTGLPFFSADVFAPPATAAASTTTIDIPIYLNPALPLTWRMLGFDGDPTLPVPDFFLARGVAKAQVPPSIDDLLSGDATLTQTAPTPPNLRLLRACDVWVHQPRLGLTSSIALEPGIATGISDVTQTLGVNGPAAGDALRVMQGDFNATPQTIDPTQSDYQEQTWDELLIGTVFLLSPPNALQGSAPDGTWQPFVRHALFWNLTYMTTAFQQLTTDPGIPFIPPLAGGAAQLVINFLSASLNDMTQNTLNILQAHSLAGSWYTPTGGGSHATFPVVAAPAAQGGTGFDKAGRIAAQAQAAATAKLSAKLDPDFPYVAVPFSPSLLRP